MAHMEATAQGDNLRYTKIPLTNGSGVIPALGFGTLQKKTTRVRSRDYNNPPTPHRMFCKFVSPRNLWKWNSLGNVEA